MTTKAKIWKALLVVAMCGALMCTACSTNWINEAEQIVAALIPATANLVTLVGTLEGRNVTASDFQTIESAGSQAGADLQLMQSLIAQYKKADTSAQPGLLNQIQVAMGAVQTSLNGLLPALHIKNTATQAKVSAVIGILLSEVQSMAAIVPFVNSSASPAMTMLAARQVKKQPPLTASEFVSSYNLTMAAKTGDINLDHATSGLRIHTHDKFARWASAGLLK